VRQSLRQTAHDLIPPLFGKIYSRAIRKGGFFGDYKCWDDARKACGGYDSDVILNRVKNSLLKVKKGEAVYERDSVLFDEIHYSWPLLAGLLWVASCCGNRLNLIDFGGSLGSSYYQNKKFLEHLLELKWSIVEQEKFVECGKEYFGDEHLKFYNDIDQCIVAQRPNAILFSSVIQYLEKPYGLLENVLNQGFVYILFDRTSFLEKGNDRITVQKVPPEIYPASYPAWFFNLDKFLDFFADQYELMAEFDSFETFPLGDVSAQNKGFIFRRRT
jgi:putative methyltransferase (TIGR04325 family)